MATSVRTTPIIEWILSLYVLTPLDELKVYIKKKRFRGNLHATLCIQKWDYA